MAKWWLMGNGSVLLGNDHSCRVKGLGSVKLRMHDGVNIIVTNVIYIPELRRNLISMGMLDSMGYKFQSEGGNMIVSRNDTTVMKGIRRNDLYYLGGRPNK